MSNENKDSTSPLETLMKAERHFRRGQLNSAKALLAQVISDGYRSLPSDRILDQALNIRGEIQRQERLRKNRLWLCLIFTITGMLLIVLASIKVRSIEIYAEFVVSGFEMKLVDDLRISQVKVESVELNKMAKIETYGTYSWNSILNARSKKNQTRDSGVLEDSRLVLIQSANHNFSVAISGDGMRLDNVYLKDKVSMVADEFQTDVGRIVITNSKNLEGELQIGAVVDFECFGAQLDDVPAQDFHMSLNPEEAIRFESAEAGTVVLRLMSDEAGVILGNDFRVKEIEFVSDEFNQSTITEGKIKFPSIRGDEITVRSGDFMKLKPANNFSVIQVRGSNEFRLRLSGRASEISRNRNSVLPSWLEWIHRSNAVLLYLGALSSAVSFIWLLLKRVEIIRE